MEKLQQQERVKQVIRLEPIRYAAELQNCSSEDLVEQQIKMLDDILSRVAVDEQTSADVVVFKKSCNEMRVDVRKRTKSFLDKYIWLYTVLKYYNENTQNAIKDIIRGSFDTSQGDVSAFIENLEHPFFPKDYVEKNNFVSILQNFDPESSPSLPDIVSAHNALQQLGVFCDICNSSREYTITSRLIRQNQVTSKLSDEMFDILRDTTNDDKTTKVVALKAVLGIEELNQSHIASLLEDSTTVFNDGLVSKIMFNTDNSYGDEFNEIVDKKVLEIILPELRNLKDEVLESTQKILDQGQQ